MTPLRESSESGRSTELCSMSVEMTWSPLRSTPWMAMFSASVAFCAKATREASASPSMFAISSRQPSMIRPASIASLWPERPGLAPQFVSADVIACTVQPGLGKLVAALSR